METAILCAAFAAALAVAGTATAAFSESFDSVLARLIPAGMAPAWSRFVKFGLFTASFVGGLRLQDLTAFAQRTAGGAGLGAADGLVETYRATAGALVAAAWTLLAFFVGTLVLHAAARAFESARPAEAPRPGERRPSDRHPSLPV
ncbi:MAG: hypothetical protein HY079_02255 [Elusimicrobia bacterium]|nr:hypothetical protein [Elusimicrobiota bacterium]